jgi:hypothetical protein
MYNIDYYIDFTSEDSYRPFYVDDYGDGADYYFAIGNSGLFFYLDISGSLIPKEYIYYSPYTNSIILQASYR